MLEIVQALAHGAARLLEVAGIIAIVVGFAMASAAAAYRRLSAGERDVYTGYRQSLARAILLGLEIFVAADIIGTVAVDPTWPNVGVLAVIVAIRTVLSFSLQVEIEGAWPWQAGQRPASSTTDA